MSTTQIPQKLSKGEAPSHQRASRWERIVNRVARRLGGTAVTHEVDIPGGELSPSFGALVNPGRAATFDARFEDAVKGNDSDDAQLAPVTTMYRSPDQVDPAVIKALQDGRDFGVGNPPAVVPPADRIHNNPAQGQK